LAAKAFCSRLRWYARRVPWRMTSTVARRVNRSWKTMTLYSFNGKKRRTYDHHRSCLDKIHVLAV
jgi:hypothetical protein